MSRGGWLTDAQKERIVHIYRLGNLTQRQIAERFGISETTVSKVLRDAGLGHASRPYTPEDEQLIRDNYQAMGPRAVGRMLGRSYDSVAHKARAMGLTGNCAVGPYGKRRRTDEGEEKHMRAEVMSVTPEVAEQMLEHNYEDNRNLREAYVTQLATVMRNGRYISENGQTIVLGEDDGVLYDGQHRLKAITLSGVTLTMLVVWITNGKEAYKTIDNGTKRQASDFIRLPNRNVVAATAKVMACIEWGVAPLLSSLQGKMDTHSLIDRSLVVAYAEQHGESLTESVRDARRMRGAVNCGSCSCYANFIELVRFCGKDEYLDEFIDEFSRVASTQVTVTAAKTLIMRTAAKQRSTNGLDAKWLMGTLLDAYAHFCSLDDSTMLNKQARRISEYSKLMQKQRERTRKASA